MKKINLKHSGGAYDIYIGEDLLGGLGGYIKELGLAGKHTKFGIISDDVVFPLYGEKVKGGLEAAGFAAAHFVFHSGEASKNLSTVGDIYNFLREGEFDRNDCLVALGGGVVGDVAGFAAATYLRGIKYVQIPTTLLSQVDSSVGGKTGVNLPQGKNLVGAFHQPQLVLCDVGVLRTLPEAIYADGMAEVIKHACIKSAGLFGALMAQNIGLADMVYQNVEIKAGVVAADEFERGERAVLNFGHTVGHAIEKYYGFLKFTHGQSVAIGMVYAAKLAHILDICGHGLVEKIAEVLGMYQLPTDPGEQIDGRTLAAICGGDKKAENDAIKFVLPEDIGRCRFVKIKKDELGDLLCKI